MADFLTLKRLEEKITDIIFHAKQSLLILSPYIKLDDYFKKLFTQHIKNPEVRIIVVFGKNEDNKGKSLRKEDFEFFKQFPNISILYLKDLHAKYYANEAEGVVTSVNLHDYSFKNNIEFGIWSKNPEQSLLGLATVRNPFSDSLDSTAWEYAIEFMKKAEAVFIKRPVIQKKLLGLSKNHMGSEVCYDNTSFFTQGSLGNNKKSERKTFSDFPEFIEYGKASFQEKPKREDVMVEEVQKPNVHHIAYNNQQTSAQAAQKGYCIRKGEPIKYNPAYPYSDVAYNVWKQWGNEDYIENFCHSCGRPHPTTKRRPLCDNCFYN